MLPTLDGAQIGTVLLFGAIEVCFETHSVSGIWAQLFYMSRTKKYFLNHGLPCVHTLP